MAFLPLLKFAYLPLALVFELLFVLFAHAALQDGLLAVCAFPGQVLQHPSGTCLVLGQHKWSLLVWPAETSDPSLGGNLGVWLDARGSAQWLHVWNLHNLCSFASTTVCWEGQGGVVVICMEKEPLLKNSLRQSSEFTFNDLALLAAHYNHQRPKNASRTELLKFLADVASDGDGDYISLVLNSDAKGPKKEQPEENDEELEAQEQLLESVLDNMDGAEKDQFDEVNTKVKSRKKRAKVAHWKKLYQEKCQEEEAAQLGNVFFFSMGTNFFVPIILPTQERKQAHAEGKRYRKKGKGRGKGKGKGRGKQPKALAKPPCQVELPEVEDDGFDPVVPRVLFHGHPEEEKVADSMAAEAPSASSLAASVPVPAEQAETDMNQAAAANLQEELANATLDAQPTEPLPAEGHPNPVVPCDGQKSKPVQDKAPSGSASVKVYSTPAILAMLEPNSFFKMRLKHNDHRFEVECTTPHEDVYIRPFDKKTFSRSFANSDWKEVLKKVHARCWEKWTLVADKYPLGPGKEAQVPGEVPAHVLEALEDKMHSMPPVVRYPKL